MAEYIEREALLEKAWDADTRTGYVQVVDVGDILSMPAADVAPVVRGRWIFVAQRFIYGGFVDIYRCSVCSIPHGKESRFCPNCGADMRVG